MTGKTRRPFRHRPLHGGYSHAAFTLVELLVVISIFVLLLAMAVPAFSSMMYSSEQALAANNLRTALAAAHDAAIRSPAGLDAAAVFTYEPGGRVSIIACVQAGELWEPPTASSRVQVKREIFVPVPVIEPVQMPRGWMVRGYAPPNMIDNEWYETTYPQADRVNGNWVFPETGFYDTESGNAQNMAADGRDRQTFMVRFEGGTGKLRRGEWTAALVLLPSPGAFRTTAPFTGPYRADREADPARFVRRVLAAPQASLTPQQKAQLLGDASSDTVLVKPVGQLAVYSETMLAGAVNSRVDSDTGSIYQKPQAANNYGPKPVMATGQAVVNGDVNKWIEGRLMIPGSSPPQALPTDSRVFAMDHYLGVPQELTGSRP